MKHSYTFYWDVRSKAAPFNTFETRTTVMAHDEAEARQIALDGALNMPPDAKVSKGTSQCETYEELVDWLKSNKVAPDDAQFGVQVMVINARDPQPHLCPKCKCDLNKHSINVVGNAYYCPKCKYLLQVG